MNSALEQRDIDAITYDTDGRCFRLEVEGDILRLETIHSVFGIKSPSIIQGISMVGTGIFFAFLCFQSIEMPQLLLLGAIVVMLRYVSLRLNKGQAPVFKSKWILNREKDSLQIDGRDIIELNDISRVTAWQKGKRRFVLALDLKSGERVLIGERCFSNKEFSWREDAQTIADFLHKPLQIPNVYE